MRRDGKLNSIVHRLLTANRSRPTTLDISVLTIRLQSKRPQVIGFAFPEAHEFCPISEDQPAVKPAKPQATNPRRP